MKKNILANFAGKFWSIISNFVFIPIYIKLIGFESYSIISFAIMITGVMTILDSGLTATLSREFARKDNKHKDKLEIFKTLQSCFFLIVFLCISIIFLSSDFLAKEWINVKSFQSDQIAQFIKIISFETGFQLLLRFYIGGLLGLERQVDANLFQIFWGILRNFLVIPIIYFFPDLTTFFLWQAFSTFIFTVLIKFTLEKRLFRKIMFSVKIRFEKRVLIKIFNFAGGMMLISLVAALNTQMDKITISKLLSIENLGYYTLSVSLAQSLLMLVNPITTALLPRFTSYYSTSDHQLSRNLFNKASLLISIIVFTGMIVMSFFSKTIVFIWTGNNDIAQKTSTIIPIITFAYAMLSLQILPFNVAISNGYTRLNNILGLVSLIVTIPGYYIAIKNHGPQGAAVVFCFIQVVTTFIYIYFINKKFIKNDFKEIFLKQIILPLLFIATIIFLFSKFSWPFQYGKIISLFWIAFIAIFTLLLTLKLFLSKSEMKSLIATNPDSKKTL